MREIYGQLRATGASLLLLLLFTTIAIPLSAQDTSLIRGKVTDETGEALPGVNVYVAGTNRGTTTDVDGNYSLQVSADATTLVYSFVGYTQETVDINGRSTMNVQLYPSVETLQEIVVVGYGEQRKRDVTGAINSVDGERISRIPTSSVAQALQGQVAGVTVTPTSGEPGASAAIRIRGVGTLNNSNPIFVVDGMIVDNIDFLNPNDIKSIEVLKDASATAIYGTRGANGVVIVSTNQGAYDQPTKVNFSASYGVQRVIDEIDLVNASQFAELANELAVNEGGTPLYPNPSSFGEGTNWQDEVFRNAAIQDYQVNLFGGSEKINYNVALNYFRQEGIIIGSDFERYTLRINNEYKLADPVTLGHNLAFIYNNSNTSPNLVVNAYRAYPIFEPFDEDGFAPLDPVGNPIAAQFYDRNDNFALRSVGNIYLDVDILKDLTFRTNFGVNLGRRERKSYTPEFFVSPIQQAQQDRLTVSGTNDRDILWENTLRYNKEFGDHSLSAVVGYTVQDIYIEEFNASISGLPGEGKNFWYLSAGDATTFALGSAGDNEAGENQLESYLARVNYAYKGKYLLTASFRRDGSSRFGDDNRYGNFPAVGVGWRISEEPFMANVALINDLKLRASYGITGNERIGNYQFVPLVQGNLNAVFGVDETVVFGATPVAAANSNLRWEETEQLDIGIELGILQNRLTFEADYYRKQTNDILAVLPQPDFLGFDSDPTINSASVTNNGWDFSLAWQDEVSDFTYGVQAIASVVDNEVNELGQGLDVIFGGPTGEGGKLATRTVVGEPIAHFYGYRTIGVFQSEEQINNTPSLPGTVPGDLIFEDITGDGEINGDDRTNIGNSFPTLTLGLNLNFAYKGVDLSMLWNGSYGYQIYNAKKTQRFNTYNFETSYLDRWTGPGTSNTEPRVTNGGINYNVSDRFLEDGDFTRLRNLQIGYTFPQTLSERWGMEKLRVYVNGTNLLTITDYSGYTPEINPNSSNVFDVNIDRGVYPISRVYTVGLDVSF
ncbi:SusC/RagA family TonB-linked outer membrane protein [Roseivirga sp. BDSF3-8]|uniref:SusC/RagA family TonB-linked outer membrane protein n=1 Tax=Roseivirga sp. BDSF3-8 TaxID=3241598 RepID=UPI003531E332